MARNIVKVFVIHTVISVTCYLIFFTNVGFDENINTFTVLIVASTLYIACAFVVLKPIEKSALSVLPLIAWILLISISCIASQSVDSYMFFWFISPVGILFFDPIYSFILSIFTEEKLFGNYDVIFAIFANLSVQIPALLILLGMFLKSIYMKKIKKSKAETD